MDRLLLKNLNNDTGKLARFCVNLLLIPHLNCYVERMYSFVKIIKSPIRNQLDVESVSSILEVKSDYDDDQQFEPDEDHYFFYKHNIKDNEN